MNEEVVDRRFRSSRLSYIMERLRSDDCPTPSRLAEELQVSERTIYRYLRSLEKGQSLHKQYSRSQGRYLLTDELVLPPLTFTPREAFALHTSASLSALLSGTALAEDLRSAIGKLGKQLTASNDTRIEKSQTTSLLESLQHSTLEMIRSAIQSNRKLRVNYWSATVGSSETLALAPYELRLHESRWYLLACDAEGIVRPYRVTRLRTLDVLEDKFRFPRKFSADRAFEVAWSSFGDVESDIDVVIRFAPDSALEIAENCAHQFASMEPQADGSLLCTIQVNSFKEIAWWIFCHGNSAEVLSPAQFRSDLAMATLSMAAVYVAQPPRP